MVLLSAGCTAQDVNAAASEVVTDGAIVVAELKAELPAGDPRIALLDKWEARAKDFQSALQAAITPDQKAGLLPIISDVVSGFRTVILPMIVGKGTNAALLAVAVDASLRIIANHISQQTARVQAVAAKSKAARVAIQASAPKRDEAQLLAAKRELDDYLKSPQLVAPRH